MNASILPYTSALAAARAMAAQAKLTLAWAQGGGAYTDGNTIYVMRPMPDWTAADVDRWFDNLRHEVGHNMPQHRDCFAVQKKHNLNMQTVTGMLTNLVEDNRVDHGSTNEFPGTKARHVSVQDTLVAENLRNFPLDSQEARILYTMMNLDCVARGDWSKDYSRPEVWDARSTPEMREWMAKLESRYLDAYHTESAEESLEYVRTVLRDVFDYQDKAQEEAEQRAKGEGKGKVKGREESDASRPQDAPTKDDDGDPASGEDNGGKDYDPDTLYTATESQRQRYAEFFDDHGGAAKESKQKRGGLQSFAGNGSGAYHPYAENRITVCSQRDLLARKPSVRSSYFIDAIDGLHIGSMASEARRYLQAKTMNRTLTHQAQGRYDHTKLHKLMTPRDRYTIFKTRVESDKLDTAVSILVDWSGSMGFRPDGSQYCKRQVAVAGAHALSTICETLHIRHEVAAFSDSLVNSYHYLIKAYDDRPLPLLDLNRAYYGANSICSSGNCDGEAIDLAARRLAAIKASRHVLIVLSDGQPSGGHGDIETYTLRIIKTLESLPNWSIIGLGILDSEVVHFYKNHKVVNNLVELPRAIIDTLKQSILN